MIPQQLSLTLAQLIVAQTEPSTPTSSSQINSILDFIVKGGVIMIPIGLCSLVALAIIVERLMLLRRSLIIPANFINGLQAAIDRDRTRQTPALEYCRGYPAPLARIFAAVVDHMHLPTERLEKEVQEAGRRELAGLRKNLRVLAVVANIAPLLGLLGTIFGMITAFQTVAASGEALGRTEALAKGIYEALITTAAGLIVAIPCVIAFHGFSAKIDALVLEMDRLVVDFIKSYRREPVESERPTAPSPQSKSLRMQGAPDDPIVAVPA